MNKKILALLSLPALSLLAPGCASLKRDMEVPRVSSQSTKIPAPEGQAALFSCGASGEQLALVTVDKPALSGAKPAPGEGTSKLVQHMRKAEESRLTVATNDGLEPLSYGGEITADLHHGSHLLIPEDIKKPRGTWQGESFDFIIQPDISYEYNQKNFLEERAELVLKKQGKTIACRLVEELAGH
jgi:hypothetical protein